MIDRLQNLGLSLKEATTYMATLELGGLSPVATIAKKARINRTTAYDILEVLVQRGLVISSTQKKSRYYSALPPEKLVLFLKEESNKYALLAKRAEKMLPELHTHYRPPIARPKIYFYEGEEGLIRVYEETLNSKEEIRAFASAEANRSHFPWYFPQYYKRRAAKKIPIRALFPDSIENRERHKLDSVELRLSRLLPKSIFDFSTEINIFDNTIMIADWDENLGIIIESEQISKVLKQGFDLAWEVAEKYNIKIEEEIKNDKDK